MIDDLVENAEDPAGGPNVIFDKSDLQGFLLKIAAGGITVQDYVKRLQEADILIAIDGKTIHGQARSNCEVRSCKSMIVRISGFLHFIETAWFLIF